MKKKTQKLKFDRERERERERNVQVLKIFRIITKKIINNSNLHMNVCKYIDVKSGHVYKQSQSLYVSMIILHFHQTLLLSTLFVVVVDDDDDDELNPCNHFHPMAFQCLLFFHQNNNNKPTTVAIAGTVKVIAVILSKRKS